MPCTYSITRILETLNWTPPEYLRDRRTIKAFSSRLVDSVCLSVCYVPFLHLFSFLTGQNSTNSTFTYYLSTSRAETETHTKPGKELITGLTKTTTGTEWLTAAPIAILIQPTDRQRRHCVTEAIIVTNYGITHSYAYICISFLFCKYTLALTVPLSAAGGYFLSQSDIVSGFVETNNELEVGEEWNS